MNPLEPAGPSSRAPQRVVPHFVPTLTEVVEGFEPPSAAEPPAPPVVPDPAPAVLPVDAVVEEVVDRVLDRLLLRLTDELEVHLARHLAQWRNEQARAWAAGWVSERMDQEFCDLREQVEPLVRQALARPAPPDERLP
jgi:hypothetical protein